MTDRGPSTDFPLADFERFRTHDLHEARRQVALLLSAHALEATHPRARLDVRYHSVELVDTALICAQYGAHVRLDPGALEDFYLVGVPLAGTSTVSCQGRELVTHPGLGSVQSCRQPLRTEWREDCRKLSVKIARPALERRLAELLGQPVRRPVVFELALDLDRDAGRSWRHLLGFVLSELSPRSLYLSSHGARRSLDDMLISALLLAQPHTYSEALRAEPRPAGPRHVRRAEEIIAADPSQPYRMADLAARAGTGLRSLQEGFRRHRGMSPQEFLRLRRLARAREALLHAEPGARVTDIALESGYTHLGRFAREYKARYGESPSHTLKLRDRDG